MARRPVALLSAAAALLFMHAAQAIEVGKLEVSLQDDRYVVEFAAQIDAPVDAVRAVLTDYAQYPALDPRITESRVVSSEPDHSVMLFTQMRGCLGALFCRTMKRVEQVEEKPDELLATAVPAESDVRLGVTRSQWQTNAGGTAIVYRMEIMPTFWIPPLFGPPLMIKALRAGTLDLFTNVEKAARERAGNNVAQ